MQPDTSMVSEAEEGGWLENEVLKKTPSPKFGLESLEFVKTQNIKKAAYKQTY